MARNPIPISRLLCAPLAAGAMVLGGCARDKAPPEPPPLHTVLGQPQLPGDAVLRFGPAGGEPVGGYAFVADCDGSDGREKPLFLTAKHLFEQAQLTSDWTFCTGAGGDPLSAVQFDRAAALALPNSSELGARSPAGDIAALDLGAAPATVPALRLQAQLRAGEPLWLALPTSGSAAPSLHRAQPMARRRGLLYYRLERTGPDLPSAAGAPVLNAAGEVVAIHLGGAQEADGSHFGIANPVSRFLPHLIAAAAAKAGDAPGAALAGSSGAGDED